MGTYTYGQQGVELGDIQGYAGAKQGVAWQGSSMVGGKQGPSRGLSMAGGQHDRG